MTEAKRNNLLSLIGLAKRAGKLSFGEDAVRVAAAAKKAKLALIASDAAENTETRVRRVCFEAGVSVVKTAFSKEELGGALGYRSAAVCSVDDIGMAHRCAEYLAEDGGEEETKAFEKLALSKKRQAERRAAKKANTVKNGRGRRQTR